MKWFKLQKWNGLGNRFLILDCRRSWWRTNKHIKALDDVDDLDLKIDVLQKELKQLMSETSPEGRKSRILEKCAALNETCEARKENLIIKLIVEQSNRTNGNGCDQFVTIGSPKKKQDADAIVRFFNADGSESGMCGNASRCVAKVLMEKPYEIASDVLLFIPPILICVFSLQYPSPALFYVELILSFATRTARVKDVCLRIENWIRNWFMMYFMQNKTKQFRLKVKDRTLKCEVLANGNVKVEMGRVVRMAENLSDIYQLYLQFLSIQKRLDHGSADTRRNTDMLQDISTLVCGDRLRYGGEEYLKCSKIERYDIGNPHLVLFFDITDNFNVAGYNAKEMLLALGRKDKDQLMWRNDGFAVMTAMEIQQIGLDFQEIYREQSNGINVEFVIIEDKNTIHMRVYERGVGETEACGSGACAAVAAGIKAGLLNTSVNVYMKGSYKGGDNDADPLKIEWSGNDDNSVFMTGSATKEM